MLSSNKESEKLKKGGLDTSCLWSVVRGSLLRGNDLRIYEDPRRNPRNPIPNLIVGCLVATDN